MSSVPTGTVTFLFTDIEGSTKLAREHPDTWEVARARHHAMLREAIECNHGYVFQIIGDAFCAAFHTAGDALRAAAKSQIDLHAEHWGDTPIKVRMGIHTGKAEIQENGEYHGYLAMSRTQRLMSAGHGGQVLISAATQELLLEDLPEDISLRDLGERRLKDLIRPEHIYQLVIPGLPIDFPPLKTLDFYRHNLPVQLTSFIGRKKEMEEIKQSMMAHRLVTLTGAGGTGKTRLSLQVAADLLDKFPHGVWFVELAPITDPDLIPQTILSALGIPERPGLTIQQRLLDYLHEKNTLLVLDNCEQLVEACAKLVDTLLSNSSTAKIMATSREALGVAGEMIWHVPSLSLPNIEHLPAIEQLSQYEAVQLFIERAMLVQPHFQVTNDNAPAVAQICFHLDGIPLAIELAAARVRALNVDQIAERLGDRFRLLTGGSRTALPRHQTLRAMIEWSYDLLSESEQALLRQLGVFVGDWTLEAGEAVCALPNPLAGSSGSAGQPIETHGVMDILLRLVDKSLVVPEEHAGQVRYRMLETIREFARDKLSDSSDSAEGRLLRERHLDYFLNFAEQAEPKLQNAEQLIWLNQLGAEYENLRTALAWARESRSTQPALRLAKATEQLGDVQFLLGRGTKAIPYYQEALELLGSVKGADRMLEASLHGKILQTVAILIGRIDRGQFEALLSVAAASRAGLVAALDATKSEPVSLEKIHLLRTLCTDATYVRVPVNWDLAEGYARDAVEMAEKLDAPVDLSTALGNLAELYFVRRLWRERLQIALRRLALIREPRFGDRKAQASALIDTGWAFLHVGEFAQAMAHLLEGQSLAAQLQNVDLEKWALEGLTYCLLGLDRWDEILNIDEKLRDIQQRYPREKIGPSCIGIAVIASIHAMRGELDLARKQRQEAQDIMTAGMGPFENWSRNQHY